MDFNLWVQVISVAVSFGTLLVALTWWLSRQFANQTDRFFARMDALFEKLANKLDYHERHDDKRFSEIREDLSELRIRNAYIDAKLGKALDQEEDYKDRRQTRTAVISGSVS